MHSMIRSMPRSPRPYRGSMFQGRGMQVSTLEHVLIGGLGIAVAFFLSAPPVRRSWLPWRRAG